MKHWHYLRYDPAQIEEHLAQDILLNGIAGCINFRSLAASSTRGPFEGFGGDVSFLLKTKKKRKRKKKKDNSSALRQHCVQGKRSSAAAPICSREQRRASN